MKNEIEVRLVLSRKQIQAGLALLLLVGLPFVLTAENFTLTTYYPAPSGIYNQMITTGQTLLARDAGSRVGIGNKVPEATLDVSGTLRLGGQLSSDPAGKEGMIYYNESSKQFRGYQNGGWGPLSGAAAGPVFIPPVRVLNVPFSVKCSPQDVTFLPYGGPGGVSSQLPKTWPSALILQAEGHSNGPDRADSNAQNWKDLYDDLVSHIYVSANGGAKYNLLSLRSSGTADELSGSGQGIFPVTPGTMMKVTVAGGKALGGPFNDGCSVDIIGYYP